MTSAIYTRSGDTGTTSLVDGTRVPKEATRISAYGDVDEANSWIGTARAFVDDPLLDRVLEFVQHRFYNCSSNLATPGNAGFKPPQITSADIEFLENAIDKMEQTTGDILGFILPGGTRAASFLHVARTVCRRAERTIWQLTREEHVDDQVRKFVNRTSDLLFAAARYANKTQIDSDVLWNEKLPIPDL